MTERASRHKLADADSLPYWGGVEAGGLRFPCCAACGHQHFPPRAMCPKCWSDRLEWKASAGEGAIHSCTVVHRASRPDFATPYVLALIDLDDAPRMMANVVGPGALEAAIGDRVAVTFEARDGDVLPQFRLRRHTQGISPER